MPIEAAEIEQVRQALVRYAGWDQVPDEVMVELCRGAELIEVKRKRSVFRRGEPGPGLFVVKSGEFKLSLISSEGREQILYLAEPGKLIGEGFLPRDVQCASSAFAMLDSEAWQFETDHVINLIGRSQPLAFALMRHMAFRANRLIDLVLDLSLRSVERRLASFLLSLAVRAGAEAGKSCVIPRQLDMNTVAARLGTVREEISRGLASGLSLRQIALDLGRAPSSISREVKRNKGARHYRAVDADDRAWRRARRRRPCLLGTNEALRLLVADKLADDWSPEQISGYLSRNYAVDSGMRVSHETIYKSLFIQTRGVLARELQKHLRSKRPIRRNKRSSTKGQRRCEIIGAVSIRERPAEAEDRAVPGHWEGDLLLGRGLTQLATLVERSTRYTLLVQLNGRDMMSVTDGLKRVMTRLPQELLKTLTWDRGMELANHKQVSIDTGLRVYFADPRSPWQRGSNENTNGLLRQYFPKGTSMKDLSQDNLDEIASKLNTRPRKTLDYDTPAARLEELLR